MVSYFFFKSILYKNNFIRAEGVDYVVEVSGTTSSSTMSEYGSYYDTISYVSYWDRKELSSRREGERPFPFLKRKAITIPHRESHNSTRLVRSNKRTTDFEESKILC